MSSDRIILESVRFYGYHGGNGEERTLGQPFEVDLEAEMDLQPAGRSDDRDDTVSYAHLYRIVRDVMEGEPKNLLEALAEEMATRALEAYPILGIKIRVKKTRPPIKGAVLSGAAVEIHRTRS